MQCLNSDKVQTFKQPEKTLEFNIIKNVWGSLARNFYANGDQFKIFDELGDVYYDCWESIDCKCIQCL